MGTNVGSKKVIVLMGGADGLCKRGWARETVCFMTALKFLDLITKWNFGAIIMRENVEGVRGHQGIRFEQS